MRVSAAYSRLLQAELKSAIIKKNKLERENAALRRDVYQCSPTSENDYEGFKWRDAHEELEQENADRGLTIATINDIVTNDKRSNKAKVLAIQYVLRKEAQP